MKYTKYKLFAAVGLYASFILIGHHGPVSAYAHEYHPLVVPAPNTEVAYADGSRVLGASTDPVLFYNPVNQTYEQQPSNLKDEEIGELWSCISQRESTDIRSFEECYAAVYPKAVVLDHGHTHSHKKHTLKMFKKDEDLLDYDIKVRKFKPHTV